MHGRMMKRVDVMNPGELGGYSAKHLTVFYTGLYRALTFPRRIDVRRSGPCRRSSLIMCARVIAGDRR
jgi:putative alpha-1,2-mannosidase